MLTAIFACHFDATLALLDGYAIWLQSGRHADNLVARIGTAATAPFPYIDPRTRDQYLRLLKQYLSWCVTRYIPRTRQNSTSLANIEVAFADVADVIERRFESHIINARPDRTRYRSLTDTQLQIIRTLIRPGTTENPFPERLQLRNWLIIPTNRILNGFNCLEHLLAQMACRPINDIIVLFTGVREHLVKSPSAMLFEISSAVRSMMSSWPCIMSSKRNLVSCSIVCI